MAPGKHHYVLVARNLKTRLSGNAFLTILRKEITEILREVSGEPTIRIKSGVAKDLTQVLLEQGIRCYPDIAETDANESIRIFHAGSVFGNLVDLIARPSSQTDAEVGELLLKVKGKWNWSTPTQAETLPSGAVISPN